MEKATSGWTLGELAKLLEGSLDGPEHIWITGPAEIETGGENSIVFAGDEDYLDKAIKSNVAAVITYRDAPKSSKPFIRVDKPKQAFGRLLSLCQNTMPIEVGIHPTAIVSPHAYVSPRASIGAYVVIETGARIEDDAKIYPFVFIGANSSVGVGTTIFPHAVLYSDVTLGNEVVIHAHAVIGSEGFGFTWNGTKHVKVPHLGKTRIDSHAEIGASTTVDRAMLGATSIGEGSKIDNQVQIGHNSVIGKHVVIVSQTGISGSCTIGDRCTLAGQVGLGDHVHIGDDVIMTARAAVSSDIPEKGVYRGAPALPYGDQLRMEASWRKVPQLLKRVKELEQKLERMSSNNDA